MHLVSSAVPRAALTLAIGLQLLVPAVSAGVVARFSRGASASAEPVAPFPADSLTVPDSAQKTGRRVNIPLPADCASQVSACDYARLINEYDGFHIFPRLRVRFSGPVNLDTLRAGVFLVAMENLTSEEFGTHYPGAVIPVNQLVWDPDSNTLFAKPDSVLDQHRRYALIVTSAVRDQQDNPVETDPEFQSCVNSPADSYCGDLAAHLYALLGLSERLGAANRVVSASLFTTMSATAWLEQARDLLPLTSPDVRMPASASRFRAAEVGRIVFRQQTRLNPPTFIDAALDLSWLGGIRTLAFGSYRAPNYLTEQESFLWAPNRFLMIGNNPTAAPLPAALATEEIQFVAAQPESAKPAGGYPVVIVTHNAGGTGLNSILGGLGQEMAREGFASIAINAVGHGFGRQSKWVITGVNGVVTEVDAGGRGVDLNRDGVVGNGEGYGLARDSNRQYAVEVMQLVRAIQSGVDLDGDGSADLDPGKIFLFGNGMNPGATGSILAAAVDPAIVGTALNAGGGSIVDLLRFRPVLGLGALIAGGRTPSIGPNAGTAYNEDYVLRDQPVKVVRIAGALEIQEILESLDWLSVPGDPLSYAPHLRLSTLPGVPLKRVLFVMGRGDQGTPNPTTSALIRAAGMQDWSVMYRHDLARAAYPALPANSNNYIFAFPSNTPVANSIALAGQRMIARFFSAGSNCSIADPCLPDVSNVLAPLFTRNLYEPIAVLPEDLGYLQP